MTKPQHMSREEYNAKNRAKRLANRDEANAKRREYYRTHKEELTAINRRWDKNHPEQKKAARRRWAKTATYQEYMKKWLAENRDRKNASGRKSYHKNKDQTRPLRLARIKTRRALKRGSNGTFSPADVQAMYQRQLGSCAGCARSFSEALQPTVDHVVPLSRGGSNLPDNLQLLCLSCNSSKCDLTMDEWLDLYSLDEVA